MKLKVKVCGMAKADNVAEVAKLRPDYMGFIFHAPSPRNAFSLAPEAVRRLPHDVVPVGVFVNLPTDEIVATLEPFGIHTLQLHGDESPAQCHALKNLGFTVWKAIGVDNTTDWSLLSPFAGMVDCFVFDTKTPLRGGSGVKYDWELLRSYTLEIPFMLSGGISPEDADSVCRISHPMLAGVDINSRFEDAPGCKNINKLHDFINKLRKNKNSI